MSINIFNNHMVVPLPREVPTKLAQIVDKTITTVTARDLEGVTSIGSYTFIYCRSLTSITIPDSVTSIGRNVFSDCTSLTSVVIPDSVTNIGEYAFFDCRSLTSITIPNSIKTVPYWGFYGCTSLTSITIPDSVTSISLYAFYGCTSLTNITVLATTPPTLSSSVFNKTPLQHIYVPENSVEAYKTASGWSEYADIISAIPQ